MPKIILKEHYRYQVNYSKLTMFQDFPDNCISVPLAYTLHAGIWMTWVFFLKPFPHWMGRPDTNYYTHGCSTFCLIPIALSEAPDLIYWPVLKTCYKDKIMNVCWLFCHAILVLFECFANMKWILMKVTWFYEWDELPYIFSGEELRHKEFI